MDGLLITKRWALIVSLLNRRSFPSADDILDYLYQSDFELSDRTLKRDFGKIRNELGIFIEYDYSKRGYFINREKSMFGNAFEELIELSNINDLIVENMKGFGVQSDYIQIESRTDLKGMENFKPLIKAVQNRRVVTFDYFKYTTGEPGKYIVRPYLLKEFERRWYLVGVKDDTNVRRTFGIDRMSNLALQINSFARDETVLNQAYQNMVGVNPIPLRKELETIQLRFDKVLGRYVKSLPWHDSQSVKEEDENQIVIEFQVYPSFELFNRIMQFGSKVKVLKPEWLAEKVKVELQESLDNYK